MAVYVEIMDDVSPRMGDVPFSETSLPSFGQAERWADELEAELLGELAAVGISTTYAVDSRGARVLRGWLATGMVGLIKRAFAASSPEADSQNGLVEIAAWQAIIARIRAAPAETGAVLSDTGASSSESVRFGSSGVDSRVSSPERRFRIEDAGRDV